MNNPMVLCRLTGPIAVENDRTRNGTIYGSSLWDKVEASDEFKEMMENKSFYIGLDHPESATRDSICSLLKETAGIVSEWKRQADGVIKVVIDVLDTPYGRIVNTLARYGSYIGLSTRAEGDLMEDGSVRPDDFEFYGADFVTVPSQKSSRMKLVLEEGRTTKVSNRELTEALKYAKANGVTGAVLERMEKELNYTNKKEKEEEMKRIALNEGLKSKGFMLLEGGYLRNLKTGRDTKILKENVNEEEGTTEYILRGGDSVIVENVEETPTPEVSEEELTPEEREVLDNYIKDEIDMVEACGSKKRMEGEEVDEDEIIYDEDGNPIIPEEPEVTEGEPTKEEVLADALNKELKEELDEEEEVIVDESGDVLVEGKHCSIKVKGKFLEAYKGRRLVERCELNRKDSLVGCIKVLRKDYNK